MPAVVHQCIFEHKPFFIYVLKITGLILIGAKDREDSIYVMQPIDLVKTVHSRAEGSNIVHNRLYIIDFEDQYFDFKIFINLSDLCISSSLTYELLKNLLSYHSKKR